MPKRRRKPEEQVVSAEDAKRYVRLFAKNLRALRDQAGFNQRQLAVRAGVSPNYITRLENAVSVPSVDLIFKLARAMSRDVGELMPTQDADPEPLLRKQLQERMKSIAEQADLSDLQMLVPLMTLLGDEISKRNK